MEEDSRSRSNKNDNHKDNPPTIRLGLRPNITITRSLTITKNDTIFFKFNDIVIQNGDLSLNVRFLEDGNYQVIGQIRSADNLAVALTSFDILVPLQPIGKFNADSLGSLLVPAGLVAMGLSVSVIALILLSRRRRKAEKTTG